MHLNDQEWERLARYLSGEAPEQEIRDVEQWIAADPRHAEWMRVFRQAWQAREKQAEPDVEALWARIQAGTAINNPPRILSGRWPRRAVPAMRVAASLILAVAAGWALSTLLKPSLHEIRVAYGTTREITLPDQTTVLLDAGSRLRYPDEFGEDTRGVILEGEGFFKVTRDPAHPFIVHAEGAEVRVLGTRFNVRAWSPAQVKVAVAEGKVAFQAEDADTALRVLLTQAQMSRLAENRIPTAPEPVAPQDINAWARGEMAFSNAPLSEVLDQLERWYDVKIACSNPARLQEHVSITIRKDALDEMLVLVGLVAGCEVERGEGGIYLK